MLVLDTPLSYSLLSLWAIGGQSRTEVRGCHFAVWQGDSRVKEWDCQGDGVRLDIGLSSSMLNKDLGSWQQWHYKAVGFLVQGSPLTLVWCSMSQPMSFGHLLEGEWFGKGQEWWLLSSRLLSKSGTSLLPSRSLMKIHRGLWVD